MMPGGKILYVMAWRVIAQRVKTRCVIVMTARRVIPGQARCIGVT